MYESGEIRVLKLVCSLSMVGGWITKYIFVHYTKTSTRNNPCVQFLITSWKKDAKMYLNQKNTAVNNSVLLYIDGCTTYTDSLSNKGKQFCIPFLHQVINFIRAAQTLTL